MSSMPPHAEENTHAEPNLVRLLRTLLMGLLAFSIAGTAVELLLLEHFESVTQWIPLIAFAIALPAVAAAALAPRRSTVRLLQAIMLAFIAAGLAGLWLHYRGNVEFALETYPAMKGSELVWEALTGATPALAPGTMVQLGLLGLAATFRHPALRTGIIR
jgi:hypothetical protein